MAISFSVPCSLSVVSAPIAKHRGDVLGIFISVRRSRFHYVIISVYKLVFLEFVITGNNYYLNIELLKISLFFVLLYHGILKTPRTMVEEEVGGGT